MKSKHTLLLLFALPLRAWSEIGFRFQLVPCTEISCSSTCRERKEISLALFPCHRSNWLLPNPHYQLVSSPTSSSSSSYVYFAVHWLVRYTEKSFSFVFFRGRCKLWFWTVRIIQHLKRHSPFVTKHRNGLICCQSHTGLMEWGLSARWRERIWPLAQSKLCSGCFFWPQLNKVHKKLGEWSVVPVKHLHCHVPVISQRIWKLSVSWSITLWRCSDSSMVG